MAAVFALVGFKEAHSAVLPSVVGSQVGGVQIGEWVAGLLGGVGAIVDGGMEPVWLPQGSQPVPTITGARTLRTTIIPGTLIRTTLTGVIRITMGRVIIRMVLPTTTATTDWSHGLTP